MTRGWFETFFGIFCTTWERIQFDEDLNQMDGSTTNKMRIWDVSWLFLTWSLIETNEYPSFTYKNEIPPQVFPAFFAFSPETCGKETLGNTWSVHSNYSITLQGTITYIPLKVVGTQWFSSSSLVGSGFVPRRVVTWPIFGSPLYP